MEVARPRLWLLCTLAAAPLLTLRPPSRPPVDPHTFEVAAARGYALAELARMERELADLDRRIGLAMDDMIVDSAIADREVARARLRALEREQQAIWTCRYPARTQGIRISRACIDNPLSKSCW